MIQEHTWETKVWGEVAHVFVTKSVAVSYLRVVRDAYCSMHRHLFRANQFTVISGGITVFRCGRLDDPSDLPYESIELKAGQSYTVPSGVWHYFLANQDGHVLEVYWADRDPYDVVDLNDIDRRTLGGRLHGSS